MIPRRGRRGQDASQWPDALPLWNAAWCLALSLAVAWLLREVRQGATTGLDAPAPTVAPAPAPAVASRPAYAYALPNVTRSTSSTPETSTVGTTLSFRRVDDGMVSVCGPRQEDTGRSDCVLVSTSRLPGQSGGLASGWGWRDALEAVALEDVCTDERVSTWGLRQLYGRVGRTLDPGVDAESTRPGRREK